MLPAAQICFPLSLADPNLVREVLSMTQSSWQYGEGREPLPSISAPTVMFILNWPLKGYIPSDDVVYQRTRGSWVIRDSARNQVVYALGVSHGVVLGAYLIREWTQTTETRWTFEGRPAPWLHAVGTSILRFKPKRGNASAVRLFLEGVPE